MVIIDSEVGGAGDCCLLAGLAVQPTAEVGKSGR